MLAKARQLNEQVRRDNMLALADEKEWDALGERIAEGDGVGQYSRALAGRYGLESGTGADPFGGHGRAYGRGGGDGDGGARDGPPLPARRPAARQHRLKAKETRAMAMLIIGGERTVLHGSDPDMLALSVLHEARRRGMRAALADDRGRKVIDRAARRPLGPACGREDAA